jgi:hypothetical protein
MTVGFSAVVFTPLIILALYVNKIMVHFSSAYSQLLTALNGPEPEPPLQPTAVGSDNNPNPNHDSDLENTDNDDHRTNRAAAKSVDWYQPPLDEGSMEFASDRATFTNTTAAAVVYDPLLGRYWFHTKIPLVRELWRVKPRRKEKARRPRASFDRASLSAGSSDQAGSLTESFSRTSWRGSGGSVGGRGVGGVDVGAGKGGRGGRLEWLRMRRRARGGGEEVVFEEV